MADRKGTKKTRKAAADASRGLAGRSRSLLSNLRRGRGVSVNFFKSHAWIIIFFMAVVVMLIGMRYRTKVNMRRITELNKELKQAESDKIAEKALYMSLIRETDMVKLANDHNLGLRFSDEPPFLLDIDEPAH